jgi:crotonobetainyl-CoA:carnitine CoA-transferase CaiB-like acyl-CoA transferase
MSGVFDGLRVIDCASYIAAPAAATVLSDFGAEVIKIEPPAGDPYRHLVGAPGQPTSPHNYAWMLTNRNKQGLALDLAVPEGHRVLRRLLERADVFITNYPLPVRRRLGVTYEELAPLNARLIYASFTGYGEVGPEANKPGFDSNAWWARSGLMDLVRPHRDLPPARSVPGMGDHPSGMALYGAIVTALYQRERTGRGAHVSSHLMGNGLWANGFFMQAKLCGADISERVPREHMPNGLANHYRCRDGRWLILSLLREEREWPAFARCIGRDDLIADPRFAAMPARHASARDLIEILDRVFAQKDLSEWRTIFDAAGLTFGFAATLDDLVQDEQMRSTGALVPFENDTTLTIDSPLSIDGVDKVQPRPAPSLGEHSDRVLRGVGYAADEIERLRATGVVR